MVALFTATGRSLMQHITGYIDALDLKARALEAEAARLLRLAQEAREAADTLRRRRTRHTRHDIAAPKIVTGSRASKIVKDYLDLCRNPARDFIQWAAEDRKRGEVEPHSHRPKGGRWQGIKGGRRNG